MCAQTSADHLLPSDYYYLAPVSVFWICTQFCSSIPLCFCSEPMDLSCVPSASVAYFKFPACMFIYSPNPSSFMQFRLADAFLLYVLRIRCVMCVTARLGKTLFIYCLVTINNLENSIYMVILKYTSQKCCFQFHKSYCLHLSRIVNVTLPIKSHGIHYM